MKNFPIFLPLEGQKVVIIGGGELAVRKARLVTAANGSLKIIYPLIENCVREEFDGRAELIERDITPDDFSGARLAIIAHEDEAGQRTHREMAHNAGALVNVVDAPHLCDFTTPSIIDRDDVVVAISTNGKAPIVGRTLRKKIEQLLPARLGDLVAFAGDFRESVKANFGDRSRQFWGSFFKGPIAQQVLDNDGVGAREAMIKSINQDKDASALGCVHIVGAGPGDPELLTLRAHRLLQDADVILYDRLVGDGILALARRDADRLYVGKAKSDHAVPQEEIHNKMIALARSGKTVVRLKGGDPFIFGRGGEELDALRAANIPAFVTPGITAATGCAAAAGMALSHRDHSQAITFLTGHAKPGQDGKPGEPDLDWQALAQLKNTLVIYMGVSTAEIIANRLMNPPSLIGDEKTHRGLVPTTPITVIENGTRDNQIIAQGTLGTIRQTLANASIKGPALLVIGDVAALADQNLVNHTNHFQERLSA